MNEQEIVKELRAKAASWRQRARHQEKAGDDEQQSAISVAAKMARANLYDELAWEIEILVKDITDGIGAGLQQHIRSGVKQVTDAGERRHAKTIAAIYREKLGQTEAPAAVGK